MLIRGRDRFNLEIDWILKLENVFHLGDSIDLEDEEAAGKSNSAPELCPEVIVPLKSNSSPPLPHSGAKRCRKN